MHLEQFFAELLTNSKYAITEYLIDQLIAKK